MEKLLTICTAAYNAEMYLDNMLQSVLNCRSRSMIELILVDDGSQDRTKEIAEKYERRFPDIIQVISKENGGSGSARNIAFEKASGKYLKIIDADDWADTKNLDIYMTCELKVCTTKKPENPSVLLALPVVHELSALCMIWAFVLKDGKNISENSA